MSKLVAKAIQKLEEAKDVVHKVGTTVSFHSGGKKHTGKVIRYDDKGMDHGQMPFYVVDTGEHESHKVPIHKVFKEGIELEEAKPPKRKTEVAKNLPNMPEVSESFKVGDLVQPIIGPHKFQQHRVIHVHADGTMNITPTKLLPKHNKYRLGAARAKPEQLRMDESRKTDAIKAGWDADDSYDSDMQKLKSRVMAFRNLKVGDKVNANGRMGVVKSKGTNTVHVQHPHSNEIKHYNEKDVKKITETFHPTHFLTKEDARRGADIANRIHHAHNAWVGSSAAVTHLSSMHQAGHKYMPREYGEKIKVVDRLAHVQKQHEYNTTAYHNARLEDEDFTKKHGVSVIHAWQAHHNRQWKQYNWSGDPMIESNLNEGIASELEDDIENMPQHEFETKYVKSKSEYRKILANKIPENKEKKGEKKESLGSRLAGKVKTMIEQSSHEAAIRQKKEAEGTAKPNKPSKPKSKLNMVD